MDDKKLDALLKGSFNKLPSPEADITFAGVQHKIANRPTIVKRVGIMAGNALVLSLALAAFVFAGWFAWRANGIEGETLAAGEAAATHFADNERLFTGNIPMVIDPDFVQANFFFELILREENGTLMLRENGATARLADWYFSNQITGVKMPRINVVVHDFNFPHGNTFGVVFEISVYVQTVNGYEVRYISTGFSPSIQSTLDTVFDYAIFPWVYSWQARNQDSPPNTHRCTCDNPFGRDIILQHYNKNDYIAFFVWRRTQVDEDTYTMHFIDMQDENLCREFYRRAVSMVAQRLNELNRVYTPWHFSANMPAPDTSYMTVEWEWCFNEDEWWDFVQEAISDALLNSIWNTP